MRKRPALGPMVAYCVHDDWYFLAQSIESFKPAGPVAVFVSKTPWNGRAGDWKKAVEASTTAGAEVLVGEWASESDQRKAALAEATARGHSHLFIPDGDEVAEPSLVANLLRLAKADLADIVQVEMDTYWHSPEFVVRPREQLKPALLLKIGSVEHVFIRHYRGERVVTLSEGHGLLHHLSYCGPDERIARKIATWSHKDEVWPGWWESKWKAWKHDKTVRDLHPTAPAAYRFVEKVPLPTALKNCDDQMGQAGQEVTTPPAWPSVSVCIPLFGGEDDIAACLASLEHCRPLLHEVIVVDNASPDGAKEVVRGFPWVRLIENDSNRGFAAASNQGLAASSGEVVLFLNSDTFVPSSGLRALIEDLLGSGTIAAAGPMSNNVGHFQQLDATYTTLERVELFAEELSRSGKEPIEKDMLVGFCLAVKRSALDETGAFDERFGLGMYEDTDLCYRMRRAGYKLVVSQRAFVHHKGSASISRANLDGHKMLHENEGRFIEKWRLDLETGYASALSGLSADRIVFDDSKKPEALRASAKALASRADISLCMIVRNEERVLRECLESAAPFFNEVIVVDTGSTDKTVEIARSFGATILESPWQESFARARNVSLAAAKGKWLFWMDADDTLPLQTGIALQRAAMDAPRETVALVVPVQFVDEGPNAGTRVDHVKLLRNLPGVRFEGRIHEQVLPSLRKHGGNIARLETPVLHSGYDTSVEGQARKRARDRRLLTLDYFERKGHPFVLFNLGMTAHFNRQHRKAVRWLRKSIRTAGATESHLRKAYVLLAVSLRELGDQQEALWTLHDGLKAVGPDPELYFQAALSSTVSGDLEGAVRNYQAALACDVGNTFNSFDIGILGFKTHHNLAGVLAQLGRHQESAGHYREAMRQAPGFLPSGLELLDVALGLRDFALARECLDFVNQIDGLGKVFCQAAEKAYGAIGGAAERAKYFESMVRTRPRAVEPRLCLAKAHLELQNDPMALAILKELEGSGIAEAAYYLGIHGLARNEPERARSHMLRAHLLNPTHEQTIDQLRLLNEELGLDPGDGLVQ
ncbi:MAG: glycosyltransferase [Armatimonadetes bacterium]|nr:glycosyltransferase [Armatimonadota bacterium]